MLDADFDEGKFPRVLDEHHQRILVNVKGEAIKIIDRYVDILANSLFRRYITVFSKTYNSPDDADEKSSETHAKISGLGTEDVQRAMTKELSHIFQLSLQSSSVGTETVGVAPLDGIVFVLLRLMRHRDPDLSSMVRTLTTMNIN